MELETAASTVEVTDSGLVIRWSDGSRSRFHSLWLRDNCPSGGDKRKAFRTFSIIDLNPELFVIDAERNDDGDLAVDVGGRHLSTTARYDSHAIPIYGDCSGCRWTCFGLHILTGVPNSTLRIAALAL